MKESDKKLHVLCGLGIVAIVSIFYYFISKDSSLVKKRINGESPSVQLPSRSSSKDGALVEWFPHRLSKSIPKSKSEFPPGVFEHRWSELAKSDFIGTLRKALEMELLSTVNDPIAAIFASFQVEYINDLMVLLKTLPENSLNRNLIAFQTGKAVAKTNFSDAINYVGSTAEPDIYSRFLRGALTEKFDKNFTKDNFQNVLNNLEKGVNTEKGYSIVSEFLASKINVPDEIEPVLQAILGGLNFGEENAIPAVKILGFSYPEETAKFLMNNAALTQERGGEVTEEAFASWASKDVDAAAEYLNKEPQNQLRDPAVAGLVQVLNRRDPEAADRWLQTIQDPRWRNKAINTSRSSR